MAYMYIITSLSMLEISEVCFNDLQIRMALSGVSGLQQPVDIRMIRDHHTSTSRGFCFLEFATGEVSCVIIS